MRYLLAFLLLVLSPVSFSCSCLHIPLKEHVNEAKAIYLGLLTGAKLVEEKEEWYIKAEFRVEEVLKGNVSKKTTVKTGVGGGDCGIPMTVGKPYMIFFESEKYYVGTCGASGIVHRHQEKEYIQMLKNIIHEQKI